MLHRAFLPVYILHIPHVKDSVLTSWNPHEDMVFMKASGSGNLSTDDGR